MPKASDLNWCRNLMAVLKDGGKWAVPRSGLVFQKHDDKLLLVEMLPGFTGQAEDAVSIKEHFEAAGFAVEMCIGGP